MNLQEEALINITLALEKENQEEFAEEFLFICSIFGIKYSDNQVKRTIFEAMKGYMNVELTLDNFPHIFHNINGNF